jgi:sialate O-acetylesterase
MRKISLIILIIILVQNSFADVRLPLIFGNNMVLQRHQPIMVWGWAEAGEKITVQLNKQEKKVITGKGGKWKIAMDPESAGGPYNLNVIGKNTISYTNVMVGEVWVCSGQSNMEWPLISTNDAMQEIQLANFPNIRHIKIPLSVAAEPKEDIKEGEWKVCSPLTAASFTAIGYYYAKQLNQELKVSIGIINATWGGTDIETWISKEGFESSDEFKEMITTIPKMNLDSIEKKNDETQAENMIKLFGPTRTSAADMKKWKEATFDDSSWPKMNVPGLWEEQQLKKFDGVIWMRKSFTVTATEAGKEAVIELGKIDDSDESYLNGVKIGELKNKYDQLRRYIIPAGVLKEGKNVVAVRVEDTGGGGGIYGNREDIKITIGGSVQLLNGEWSFNIESIIKSFSGVGPNELPTLLYNSMISPLIPYTIKGILWYQGENNAWRAYQYRKAFPLLINDWKNHWGQGEDFLFYYVQLATFKADNGNSKNGSAWAELREAQTMTLSVPNTGMVVTTDIGDPNDIHPRNKQDVAKRLAAIRLKNNYGKNNEYSGPIYQTMKVEGNKIILTFTHIGTGLMAKDKYGYLRGFEIAGADQKFHHAKAFIEGNTVIVFQENVTSPVAVRFGWADDASENNFYNKDGFPAVPFRTDNWKGITENAKYKIK